MQKKDQIPCTQIRDAAIEDLAALASLHVQTFNETHGSHAGGPTLKLREHQWRDFFESQKPSEFCLLVEMPNREIAGFAKGIPYHHSELPDYSGELNKIYLLKKYQRKGLGSQLITEVAHRFLSHGISSMLLFGSADNPSNRFYEALGGEKLFASNGEFHGGYGWKNLNKLLDVSRSAFI